MKLCSYSIWQHLLDMTANGNKTVVITTHYIEEARQAHTVRIKRTIRVNVTFYFYINMK